MEIERDSDTSGRCRPELLVLIASCIAAIGGIIFGYDIGVVSGAILQLTSEFSLSCKQRELVVSTLLIGAMLASVVGGFLLDRFGRRLVIIANAGVFIVGSMILAFAQSFPILILGRIILGFGVSLSATADCIYISEISPPNKRGMLVSLNELGITVGFLFAYLINYAFISVENGWRFMFGLSVIPALILLIFMIPLPQSPRFLMMQQKETKARRTLNRLRRESEVDEEIKDIRLAINEEKITGQPNILFYAPTVFQTIGFQNDAAAIMASVGLGVVKTLSTIIVLSCIDRFGRRVFFLTGVSMMLVSITALGLVTLSWQSPYIAAMCENNAANISTLHINYTQHKSRKLDPHFPLTNYNFISPSNDWRTKKSTSLHPFVDQSFSNSSMDADETVQKGKWVAVISLMLYVAGFNTSFGPGVWLILSEIFPQSIRGRAISIALTFSWGTNIIVSATFLDLTSAISVPGTFLTYGVMCAIALVFVFVFLPETKGKTLEEICHQLNNPRVFNRKQWCLGRRCDFYRGTRYRRVEEDVSL